MSRIVVQDLSLKFRIYHDAFPSLKNYFVRLVRGDRRAAYSDFWAIDGISFEVTSGELVGIVGRNGAGKSTLLKAICRVYEPSGGSVRVDGRIAPLLEVGAGFHPEFTGRENMYLNGAILGYTREEVREVEDDVIAFAELEEFIDTPVKYYSTGMYLRLGFSLATAMRPDILILDEVFSGGDDSFMKKAQERMRLLIKGARITLMVSHNHDLLLSFCNRIIWVEGGKIIADGEPQEIVARYLGGRTLNDF